ncbi:hypothetical protein DY023_00690 [Microbacterium bovistercoris]|uniref:Small multidrug efflux protein n=1 Tax=Microbacterium bovistercoris TaxID=2293570 RepID=A0A371NY74_9MICO|nr:hypothetical protein [Microbacterium bovistercoris]REJ08520.1 hypothetical protein DY023_00690 [Microbacterium bovistercoris]
MHDALVEFTQSLPAWLQWLGVMAAAAIPFVESHFGTLIGVVAGVPVPVAMLAAIAGNAISMLAFVFTTSAARNKVLARRGAAGADDAEEPSARRQRVKRMLERFGVPGVSLLGPMVVPNQFTSSILVSLGANRTRVIVWTLVSIVLWSAVFALIAQAGVMLLK